MQLWMKMKIGFLYLWMNMCWISLVNGVDESELSPILKKILDPLIYEKSSIPIKDDQKPIQATVSIFTNDMIPRENLDMHFTYDFFFTIEWNDYRLKHNLSSSNDTVLPFDYTILKDIWAPNLYFAQTKDGLVPDFPQPNVMVTIAKDGDVRLNYKIILTLFCAMDLTFYPFDIQKCNLNLESYSYGLHFLNISWGYFIYDKERVRTQDFNKVEIKTDQTVSTYHTIGQWKGLIIEFTFYRNAPLYLIRDFLPCTLIVMLSWVNFWINFRSTPARTALGITTVLTIVTMTNNVRNNSPSSSGLFRSIDFYMLVCNMFVFAALVEGALVGMTAPNEKYVKSTFKNQVKKVLRNTRNKSKKLDMADVVKRRLKEESEKEKEEEEDEEKITSTIIQRVRPITTETFKLGPFHFYKGEIHIIDRICRFLFPFLFLVFNFTFFIFHMLKDESVL
eukprot:TCONS_00058879-protein